MSARPTQTMSLGVMLLLLYQALCRVLDRSIRVSETYAVNRAVADVSLNGRPGSKHEVKLSHLLWSSYHQACHRTFINKQYAFINMKLFLYYSYPEHHLANKRFDNSFSHVQET